MGGKRGEEMRGGEGSKGGVERRREEGKGGRGGEETGEERRGKEKVKRVKGYN